ncbi:MAG: cytochrome b N-terminal domain-containing protein, partial [Gemmatimonadetes bacterium]|nr:cytochrome b N-terminal domain-containing protein [Gemmatimonadota bacterium]
MATEPPRATRGLLAVAGATMGDIATAAFALCAVSGALLIPAYDAHDGRASIAQWLLTDAGAVYLRNVHYWTAQVVVIATLLHLVDHLRLGSERRLTGGVWLRVVLSLPILGFLMLSGFTLRGDADAEQAQRVVTGVLNQLPVLGPLLATFLFGTGDRLHVVYAQHASVATIIVWLVIVEHARRLWPRATAVAGYALLCGIGLFLRSDQWRWQPDWPNGPGDLRPGWILSSAALAPTARHAKVPVVMGHAEGCLVCHAGVTGLGVSHQPEAIGCASCHGGNVHSLDARRAHAGMIRVPGNLADASRTCGQAACHVTIIPRIERSIMTTFAGVI